MEVIDGKTVFRVRVKRDATSDKELADHLGIEHDGEIQAVHLHNHPIPVSRPRKFV